MNKPDINNIDLTELGGSVPAERNGAAMDPTEQLEALANEVREAKAKAEAAADEPLTIADVAAAAITALETLVAILPPKEAQRVIEDYEDRALAFKAAFIENEAAGTSEQEEL